MNTPTPAQALGDALKMIGQPSDFRSDYEWQNCARECMQFLVQHGQHFAGLESEVERLRAMQTEWLCTECNTVFPKRSGLGPLGLACKQCGCLLHPTTQNERMAAQRVEAAEARVREADGLITSMVEEWRAVAEKHRQRAERCVQNGDEESEGFSRGMAERSDYCANELVRIAAFLAAKG